MFVISSIVTLLIAYWFYESAKKVGKDAWWWVAVGVIVFHLVRFMWTYGILRIAMGESFSTHSTMTGYLMDISSVLIGFLVIVAVRYRVLLDTAR